MSKQTVTIGSSKDVYRYCDDSGKLVFEVLRKDNGKFSVRRPDPEKAQVFVWNLENTRRDLIYNLPALIKAGPNEIIFIVEGERRVNILNKHKLIATTNPFGPGKWHDDQSKWLRGRHVAIIPDNDEKGIEHADQVAFSVNGVATSLKVINLPGLAAGESVDDWLARGGTPDILLQTVETVPDWSPSPESPLKRSGPYEWTFGGLYWRKPDRNEGYIRTKLTNFTASITADVVADDGAEKRREYEIEANLHGRVSSFRIPANQFSSLNWVPEHLGGGAVIEAGQTKRDHARAAIQHFSGQIPEKVCHEHLGWTKIQNDWYYLHANGTIGPAPDWTDWTVRTVAKSTQPQRPSVQVSPPADLQNYLLPEPPTGIDLVNAVIKSLEFLSVGPDRTTFPLYSAIYAPILSSVDYSLFATGQTGAFKTSVEALALQHYGPKMDASGLPGHWTGTGNALEYTAFLAKDALFLIDDFVPGASTSSMQDLNALAERIFRGTANKGGRQRMTRNLRLAGMKSPRCLIISSGEDVPLGHSLRGRMLILEFTPSAIDPIKLSDLQRAAADGTFSQALAGFIQWVAPRYEVLRQSVKERSQRLRDEFRSGSEGQHNRTPSILASLATAFGTFLEFAKQKQVVSDREASELWNRCVSALKEVGGAQNEFHESVDPTKVFFACLRSALVSGKAHVADTKGNEPANPQAWGWRLGEFGSATPLGDRIGWVDGEDLYLEPKASYRMAKQQASAGAENIFISEQSLRKRLKDQRMLKSWDQARSRLTIRKVLEGAERNEVLHIAASHVVQVSEPSTVSNAQPSQPVAENPHAA